LVFLLSAFHLISSELFPFLSVIRHSHQLTSPFQCCTLTAVTTLCFLNLTCSSSQLILSSHFDLFWGPISFLVFSASTFKGINSCCCEATAVPPTKPSTIHLIIAVHIFSLACFHTYQDLPSFKTAGKTDFLFFPAARIYGAREMCLARYCSKFPALRSRPAAVPNDLST
jgi:hypothetical protein